MDTEQGGLRDRRGQYEQITARLAGLSVRLKIYPNTWTAISVGFGVVSGVAFAQGAMVWGVVWMALMGLTDMFDGATARALNMSSRYGAVLDPVADRYGEFFVFTGIAISGVVDPAYVMFALFGMVMASYVRAGAESKGGLKDCNVGMAGRLEKLLILTAGVVVETLGVGTHALSWAMVLIGLMSHVTAMQRLRYTYKMVHNSSDE